MGSRTKLKKNNANDEIAALNTASLRDLPIEEHNHHRKDKLDSWMRLSRKGNCEIQRGVHGFVNMCLTFSVWQASANIFDLYPDPLSVSTRLIEYVASGILY